MTNTDNDGQTSAREPEGGDAAERYDDLPLEELVAALRGDLAGAQQEAGQNLDLAQRAQAELVNYRRRADEERISVGKYSNSRLIAKLLPVTEELDLAMTHAGESGPNASWLEGVKLIQRKLLNLLESEGVAPIEGVGATFNPLEHEALGTEETTDHPPGFIIQVIRAGYRLHDRVIQPAQVIVAREPQTED
jgi:molecular chaperone GrpE